MTKREQERIVALEALERAWIREAGECKSPDAAEFARRMAVAQREAIIGIETGTTDALLERRLRECNEAESVRRTARMAVQASRAARSARALAVVAALLLGACATAPARPPLSAADVRAPGTRFSTVEDAIREGLRWAVATHGTERESAIGVSKEDGQYVFRDATGNSSSTHGELKLDPRGLKAFGHTHVRAGGYRGCSPADYEAFGQSTLLRPFVLHVPTDTLYYCSATDGNVKVADNILSAEAR